MYPSSARIFTIGHSSRPLSAFLGLLAESKIECIVDVRRLPGSRSFPQYNADQLAASLAEHGVDYWYLQALAGRRSTRDLQGAVPAAFWRNVSFARYAAYARGEVFAHGLHELMQRARQQPCAVMCSEAVWWRCHRRIIADHLLALCVNVCHIMGPTQVVVATLTRGARTQDGEVIYPTPCGTSPANVTD